MSALGREAGNFLAAASWAKKLGWTRTNNFPTDSCKVSTEDITGAEKFSFCYKFFKKGHNRGFPAQILYF